MTDALRATAAEQATALGSTFVGSEHLFLAWLMVGSGPAHEATAAAGLTADVFRALLTSGGSPKRSAVPADGGLSSHAQRVVTLADELAVADGRESAGNDDVLLALIREPRGAVARALSEAKVKPSNLKALLRPKPAKQSPHARREAATHAAPPAAAERSAPEPRRERAPAPQAKPAERTQGGRPKRDPEIDDIPEPRAPERPRLTPPPKPVPLPKAKKRSWSWIWILYLAVPASIWAHYSGGDHTTVFLLSCLAIIPLAALISNATEQVAVRTGPMLGGFLNATFGNATEVIVAIAALNAGYIELVKASITGSILSNLLLILGLALFAGGLRQPTLKFSRTAAGMSAAMLALAVAGLVLPSILNTTAGEHHVTALSEVVAGILAVTYIGSLLFTLHTHKRLFAGGSDHGAPGTKPWPLPWAIGALALATIVVAVESELLVDTIGAVTQSLHMSELFVGLIVIPIVGNAAEHATAIVAARRGNTELAVQIAVGSSTQVALLVAPLLVLVGVFLGRDMNLVFPMFQVVALAVATIVSAIVTLDGESHWFEGMQLLALYAMLCAAAWVV